MNILVTNDDGYAAPGLLALKTALSKVGTVTVVAPEHNFSASGHVKTMHKPLRISPGTAGRRFDRLRRQRRAERRRGTRPARRARL